MQRALEMLDSGVPVPLLCKVAVCQPSECIVSVQVGQWSGSAQVPEVLHFERDLPQVDVQPQALHCVLVGMETWSIPSVKCYAKVIASMYKAIVAD